MEHYYQDILPSESFLSRVYLWMATALTTTALSAYFVASSTEYYELLISKPYLFYGLIFGQLALVLSLSIGINRLSYGAALAIFMVYSVLNGVTLSPILKVFTDTSLAIAFFSSAIMFGIMGIYGYFTDADLSKFRNIFMMMLVGLIITPLVNLYFRSTMVDTILSAAGILVFCGLIAFDMQKIKRIGASSFRNMEDFNKACLIGALSLYLDLINLFLYILRFVGKKRNN